MSAPASPTLLAKVPEGPSAGLRATQAWVAKSNLSPATWGEWWGGGQQLELVTLSRVGLGLRYLGLPDHSLPSGPAHPMPCGPNTRLDFSFCFPTPSVLVEPHLLCPDQGTCFSCLLSPPGSRILLLPRGSCHE